ncbi:50S ribosomal protein L11 methyltransferase [Spongiibacter tropicus]|uniref:50S ribosomal protein L11 methyltransferase n=1 Tax=Spongiibacter tropicus TaxID=454602 RepID=UPI0003B717AA
MNSFEQLQSRLRDFIPGADLSAQTLPLAPELQLWLLDECYPQHLLDSEQIQRIMNYPAYWCFCWGSGQVMARYLLDHPELVRGKSVVDFGCGSAVAAIAAAKAGAASVVACDLDPDAILSSYLNAELNAVELEYSADFFADERHYDVILVADVLYDRANLPLLDCFRQRADTVLVADSRVKNFSVPGYRHIQFQHATTIPDLSESEEFSRINLYLGEADQAAHR